MEAFCRGLIIDKTKGNIIKIDRHKYVRKVFHGKNELDSAEKKTIYGIYVWMHASMYIRKYMYAFICIYIYVYICLCIYIDIH
jgi:hypothetical protein